MHKVSDIMLLCKRYILKVSLDVGSVRKGLQEGRTHKYAGLIEVDRVILSMHEKTPKNYRNR